MGYPIKKLTAIRHILAECLSKHKDPTGIEYYLCGPLMINFVIAMLGSLGVEENMIHYDKF